MSLLGWIGHVLMASTWFVVNLAIAAGLYLLSAAVATQPGAESGVVFVRLLATFWFYIAAWKWVVRGILARPEPPIERKKKLTGADLARGSAGCLANLLPIPFLFRFVGGMADEAWAGLTGPDPTHPARVTADRLLGVLLFLVDHADRWLPGLFAVLFLLVVMTIVRGRRRSHRHRDTRVRDANAETLARLRTRKKGNPQQPTSDPAPAAGRLSSQPPPAPARGAGRHDAVLGQLSWSSAESAWWGQREGGFPVLVAGSPDGPDPAALTQAHQVAQRSFEVLLRASEAARPAAQSRGVGLPRFTIAAVRVGDGQARLHLRCDGDGTHEYVVDSTDGLQTFHASA